MTTHSDREILKLVRAEMSHGLSLRKALTKVILALGPGLDPGRRRYLYRVIPGRVERAERRAEKRRQAGMAIIPTETPLPDDSTPLSYEVSDDGRYVVVTVDRYLLTYALTFGKASLAEFASQITQELIRDVGSEIRFQARLLAQEYFNRLPKLRKQILRRPF